jgi:hypothetical protein
MHCFSDWPLGGFVSSPPSRPDELADQGSAGPYKLDRFFVITGGRGSGKSTLIDVLRAQDVQTMPEAGRAIIQDQVAIGGDALPWGNRLAFAESMLEWEMRSYREAQSLTGAVIFDRGIPDVLGCLSLSGLRCIQAPPSSTSPNQPPPPATSPEKLSPCGPAVGQ